MKRLAILASVGAGWPDVGLLQHAVKTLADSGLSVLIHGSASPLAEIASPLGVLCLPSPGIGAATDLLAAWSAFGLAAEVHTWPVDKDRVTAAVAKAARARGLTLVEHQIGARSA